MAERRSVVVARQWHHPQIEVGISHDGISIAMGLEDFLRALVASAGSPVFTLTRAQQLQTLTQAATAVVDGMKQATVQVM